MAKVKQTTKHHKIWRRLGGIAGGLVALIILIWVAFQVSPWPESLFIRYAFDQNNAKVSKALEKFVPTGVIEVKNQQYEQNNNDAYLDVFSPSDTTKPTPTVVWVHGGAWVAGSKDAIDNYLKIIAAHGYTTVSINYTLAPERQYPGPILQLNDALGYLNQNAARLHIDTAHMAMAGDSAGSQIVAQMANVVTSPAYAKSMNVQPNMQASSLKAMLLNCGAYDLALPDYNGPFGGFLHTVLWAYSGTKDFLHDPRLKNASVVNYVTAQFPPSFITAGNADPLEGQSTEFATKLQSLGVQTSTLFYAKDHQPQLPHEYQFNLDDYDGKQALQRMLDFLQQHLQ